MSNPSVVSLQLTAGVANGIALVQTPAAAGNLVLNGSLVSGGVAALGAVARRVAAVSANAGDTTQTLTIYGTNRDGIVISEALVLNGLTTVYTKNDFLTVSQVAISAGTAGNVTVGTNGVASSPWVLDNFLVSSWNLAVAVKLASAAGATYTVEHTYDDPNTSPTLYSSMESASFQPPVAWPNPTLVNMAADGEFQYNSWPIFAHRLTITAGTGKATMQSIQSGINK